MNYIVQCRRRFAQAVALILECIYLFSKKHPGETHGRSSTQRFFYWDFDLLLNAVRLGTPGPKNSIKKNRMI